ncbi:M81 family metallopeptidase [Jiangella anatolica]|uniref:Microcystin degradation protein MlrC n=1 Tax=Jiangella anatolica TaxID=2670374 RepID=A0A2W2BGP1_9ACTN|nr:M81 family metallopeptidase [Jiangella anatolica]PZF86681.1 hypothetical protein C1I92_00460 [Jiangella anatolica]
MTATGVRRIGLAMLVQESNSWSARQTELGDFQTLRTGAAARELDVADEYHGAAGVVRAAGHEGVPLLRAWAMSGGPLTADAAATLERMLLDAIRAAGRLDGLYLGLHGALAADGIGDVDGHLLAAVRDLLGPEIPVAVSLDLHANLTRRMVRQADIVVGYHTYPHIDQVRTGAAAARLLIEQLTTGVRLRTYLAKRPMLVPAEAQSTGDGPIADLRRLADAVTSGGIRDVSIFPVQPWLDVGELGFAVTAVAPADHPTAQHRCDDLAETAWDRRHDFDVELYEPRAAIERARTLDGLVVLSESADSPTAGATGDSPAMVDALLRHGAGLRSLVTVADPAAVAACHDAGPGTRLSLDVGAGIDRRFHRPVRLTGEVRRLGAEPVELDGPFMKGTRYDMGRFAVVDTGLGPAVLLTEQPAPTFDLAPWRHAGLDPREADIVVVRSAHMYTQAYAPIARAALTLDLPGASTPRLDTLAFTNAPRPLYPLDS